MMYFTTNQLSLTSFVAVSFKQLFLYLVKYQLSIKTSVRQFAEDSRPASCYKIQWTGLSSFPLWFTPTAPNGQTLSKATSPASACEFLRPDETGCCHARGERRLSPAVIEAHWVTPWAAEQLLLQLLPASARQSEHQQGPSEHTSCRPEVHRNEHTYLSSLSWKWMGKTSEEWAERQDLALGTAFETKEVWAAVLKKQRKWNIWKLSLRASELGTRQTKCS